MVIDEDEGKYAVTEYAVIENAGRAAAFVAFWPRTGRTHQIRLQCSCRHHPIVGDGLYNATTEFGPQTDDFRARWIALHARRLVLEHPIEKCPVDQTAALPDHWNLFPINE